ncbi:MAG: ribosome-associated translation inhibitor RaiA, partial [Eubacteriales bacterium]|nr:ribosome-associated translation inhibitor RaiA [Eubacteriales bacterium]
MKFTFTEKRMDSSEDLRAYAMRKIGKLDRFFKTEAEAIVTFSLERGRFRAEITIHNNGLYYRASELTNDMYASVDSGVAAIERQIRRNKTRLAKRLREGALERDAVPAYVQME